MAARRISAQFLTLLQRPSVGNGGSTSLEALAVPWQGRLFPSRGLHSDAQAKADNEETRDYESGKMVNEGGGSVDDSYEKKSNELKQQKEQTKGVAEDVVSESSHKVGEAKENVKETTAEAGEKATAVKDQAKEKVKETTAEAGGKATEAKDQAAGQVAKNVDTAKDMFKDMPSKVSETATGLKEVGVEAAKAVKRDAEKVAQKVGLKTD